MEYIVTAKKMDNIASVPMNRTTERYILKPKKTGIAINGDPKIASNISTSFGQ